MKVDHLQFRHRHPIFDGRVPLAHIHSHRPVLRVFPLNYQSENCGPLGATNALKHSIDQSEDRILQINQSKNALKQS